jgi:hypothetical protein
LAQFYLPFNQALQILKASLFAVNLKQKRNLPQPILSTRWFILHNGYATHVAVLNQNGFVTRFCRPRCRKSIHPGNVLGQIEGGVVMSFGLRINEHFILKEGLPDLRFGKIGFPTTVIPTH